MTENIKRRITTNLDNYSTLEHRFNEAHNNKYDYSKSVFTRNRDKIQIICPIHGVFSQRPTDHLRGSGCSHCSGKPRYTTKDFIKQSKILHKCKYQYDKTIYEHSQKKVIINCIKHGEFLQRPCMHLQGQGCEKCSKEDSNFNRSTYKNKKTYLYVSKINNEFYKIGITRRTPTERAKYNKTHNTKIIRYWVFTDGEIAYNLEKQALKETRDNSYKGENIMRTGNTELRTINPIPIIEKLTEEQANAVV